jgi:hypothetical protein
MSALTHDNEKANPNSPQKKQPQNSSYKVQRLHAAVLLQSGSNSLRSLVADLVAVLQNLCRPSRTAMKKQTQIHDMKTNHKIHLTRYSVRTLLFCCRAAAIAFAPSTPIWLLICKTHVGIPAEKNKTTHKDQRLHSADFARFHARRKRCAIRI